ncbi:FAD-binding protein [Endozoicomonas atrinae]|uniref:FAD-binding protein n=1 Tax=Endozoicomonas atrinae TaxID=1333660 RepID=UPI003AFFE6EC
MSKIANVWVFSDVESRQAEVLAGARELGEVVSAFVIGTDGDVAKAYAQGADKVYLLGTRETSRIVEDYADTMAKAISEAADSALILLPGTRCCKALASLLGVKLKAGVVTEAYDVTVEDGGVTGKRMVYGGLAHGQEKVASPFAVMVVSGGVFAPESEDAARTGETINVEFVAPKATIKCLERQPKQATQVDLGKAKRIVSIGRGIAKKEDIAMAEALGAAIDAELGCSRPIAESEKWLEQERYVGISGVMPKPELYLALGISGQIQHMVAANSAQVIVAVNKDKNAPIFQYADYGIVGDLYKIVPALTAAFGEK